MTNDTAKKLLKKSIFNISAIEKGAGLPTSTLQHFVRGKRRLTDKNLKKLQKYLVEKGVSIN